MKATIQLVGAAALLALLLSGCRGNSTATPTTTPDSRSGLAGSNGRIPDVENSAK